MDNKVTYTQGREFFAYARSVVLTAGNSHITHAKIPGLLHYDAGLMPKPALEPEDTFIPNERDSLLVQNGLSVLSEVRGLPLSSQVSAVRPFLGTVSLFN